MFLLVGRAASPGLARFFAQLVGLLLALDTIARADYLFMKSAQVGGAMRPSDVAGISSVMGGPTAFWGGLIAIISVVLLTFDGPNPVGTWTFAALWVMLLHLTEVTSLLLPARAAEQRSGLTVTAKPLEHIQVECLRSGREALAL